MIGIPYKLLFPSSFNFRWHPSSPISYHDVGFLPSHTHGFQVDSTSPRADPSAPYPQLRCPLLDFPGDNQPPRCLRWQRPYAAALQRPDGDWRSLSHVGGAKLRQQEGLFQPFGPPLETQTSPPADAHTTGSICAHLPPQSVTPWCPAALVLELHSPGLAQGHFWCTKGHFLVHLVILLVVLLVFSNTGQDVLSKPLPRDALDPLPLL